MLNKQKTLLLLLSRFLEAHPDTQLMAMSSPHGDDDSWEWYLKVLILASSLEGAAIWKPGLKKWNVFLNGLLICRECCDTSKFTVCKFRQLLGSQNLLRERSLQASASCQSFKVPLTPLQKGAKEKECGKKVPFCFQIKIIFMEDQICEIFIVFVFGCWTITKVDDFLISRELLKGTFLKKADSNRFMDGMITYTGKCLVLNWDGVLIHVIQHKVIDSYLVIVPVKALCSILHYEQIILCKIQHKNACIRLEGNLSVFEKFPLFLSSVVVLI